MKLEQQVCNLELARRLKELGVGQESYFTWYETVGSMWSLGDAAEALNNAVNSSKTTAPQFNFAAAFTVAELGEILPPQCIEGEHITAGKWKIDSFEADTEADARAKMLIYLLENNLLTP